MAKKFRVVTYLPSGQAKRERAASPLESVSAGDEVPNPEALAETSRALRLIELEQRDPGVMSTVKDPLASLLQTYMAKFAPEDQLSEAPGGGLEAKFDEHDILGWVLSVFTWYKKLNKFTWQEPDSPAALPNATRVAVFGDWATGLYGAPIISRSIVADAKRYQLVLHLGDTYYSGDDDEVADRLMETWPRSPQAVYRALNGNHEMYTGGNAYYRAVCKEFGQKSTYFAFQNDHWILAGLDSAYDDHDLHGNQAQWLESLMAQAGGRKLLLFSHHQPYSLLDDQGPKLVSKLSSFLSNKQIFAWYWGHEHRCVLYDPHPVWGLLGRCIGHGGFPYFRDKLPGGPHVQPAFVRVPSKNFVPSADILDGPNPFVEGHENDYGPHGYVTLEFDGPHLNEVVQDATGQILRQRPLA